MAEDVVVDEEGKVIETSEGQSEPNQLEDKTPETPPEDVEESSGEEEEEQGHPEETDEEAEARKERNRAWRERHKQRRKDHLESLKREIASRDRIINEMNQRLSTVERKSTGSEMAQLDRAEQDAVNAYNHFKGINAKAIEQANGAAAIEAQEKMFQARQRLDQIKNIRTAFQRQQQTPQPLDPRLLDHAQAWMRKNTWYNPSGEDEDSALVLTLDNRMAKEGWDPTTPEYWRELTTRVSRVLPHRVKTSYNSDNAGKRSAPPPVAGSGKESTPSAKGTYRLSAERVEALKQAGSWDDPKLRADAIKRFQQFDKEQKA